MDNPFHPGAELAEAEVLFEFVREFHQLMDDLFESPPTPVQGEELDELRAAWREVSEQDLRGRVEDALRREGDAAQWDSPGGGRLAEHGLTGASLQAKMGAIADRFRAWRRVRTSRRLFRAAEVAGGVWGSLADALGVGHAYREIAQWVQYLSGIALSES